VINALRRGSDNRELEFVKSREAGAMNFSSRHYDFKRNQWVFGEATEETIVTFLERKIYWQSKLVGGDVWLAMRPKRSICKRPPISWLSWRTSWRGQG